MAGVKSTIMARFLEEMRLVFVVQTIELTPIPATDGPSFLMSGVPCEFVLFGGGEPSDHANRDILPSGEFRDLERGWKEPRG